MQAIHDHHQYAAAVATLGELTAAHQAATEQEAGIISKLAAPDESYDPLEAGLRLLRGEKPQLRDLSGLNVELSEVRERLKVLTPAVEQQRSAVAALTGDLSAEVCAAARPAHEQAVQGVVDALLSLRLAMAAEAAVRADIEAAGYRCTLEAVTTPELDFDDSQSTASRFLAVVKQYVELAEMRKLPAVRVRHLTALAGCEPGDVVSMTGIEAAALVKQGVSEVTTAKVGKAPRSGRVDPELVLS